jgi:hypothetical protein
LRFFVQNKYSKEIVISYDGPVGKDAFSEGLMTTREKLGSWPLERGLIGNCLDIQYFVLKTIGKVAGQGL